MLPNLNPVFSNILSTRRGSGNGTGKKFFKRHHSESGMMFNFNNFGPEHGSGYGSGLNFLRRRSFESGRVLNFNSLSPIRGPGYESGIKFVTWHNTESGNEPNFNFLSLGTAPERCLNLQLVFLTFYFSKVRSHAANPDLIF